MIFCANCGTQADDGAAFCANCGKAIGTQPAQPQPQPQAAPAQPRPQPQAAPAQPQQQPYQTNQQPYQQPQPVYIVKSPFAKNWGATLKAIFSSDPYEAVSISANSGTHLWSIFGAAYILLMGLAALLIYYGLLGRFPYFNLPLGRFFAYGIVLSLITLIIICGGVKSILAIYKEDFSFLKVINLVTASFIFSSLALVAAILFSFFLARFSLALLVVGWIGSIIPLHYGINKLTKLKPGSYWLFLIVYAIAITIMYQVTVRFGIPVFSF